MDESKKHEISHKPTPTQVPKRSRLKWVILSVIALLVLTWGTAGVIILQQKMAEDAQVTQRQELEDDGNKIVTSEESAVASVVEKVSSSVVSILTEKANQDYWGEEVTAGAGSGFIVSSDGVVLTNRHVVADARQFEIILSDGTTYDEVKVIATDPLNDIAFLKINNATDLPVAKLGDSSTVRVGQLAIAIGNSLGQYQNTVTKGIISGTGRPIAASDGSKVEQLTDLLQTDAAINPGNSGGPLLNAGGQVIGINTAIVERAQSLGFAIPINAAKGMLKQVLAGEKTVRRAYIGVSYLPINAQIAKKDNLPVKEGAYVWADPGKTVVEPDSPADKAGIKKGDIITKVNDVQVGPKGSLSSLISEYAPGDKVELTLRRGDATKSIVITLGAYQP